MVSCTWRWRPSRILKYTDVCWHVLMYGVMQVAVTSFTQISRTSKTLPLSLAYPSTEPVYLLYCTNVQKYKYWRSASETLPPPLSYPILSLLALLARKYKCTNTDAARRITGIDQEDEPFCDSIYLLYWYKSTDTDATRLPGIEQEDEPFRYRYFSGSKEVYVAPHAPFYLKVLFICLFLYFFTLAQKYKYWHCSLVSQCLRFRRSPNVAV